MPTIMRAVLPTPDAIIFRSTRGQVVVLADYRVTDHHLAAVVVAARALRDPIVMDRAS